MQLTVVASGRFNAVCHVLAVWHGKYALNYLRATNLKIK